MSFQISDYFAKISVLDHGSVELIDGMLQNPCLKIVNSARVSFLNEVQELSEKDLKLIKFLYKHEHFSTFRHSYFSFRLVAPIMVFRQWWKYQIGSDWSENESLGAVQMPETNWNEASGRYVEFEPSFYVPSEIRIQSQNNKQGSHGKLEKLSNGADPVEFFRQSCLRQYQDYELLVASGAAKEQCRGLLPQNIYSQCIWTCSLQCLLYFLHQRLKSDAQMEIRLYAQAVWQIVKPMLEPLADLVEHD